MLKPQTKLFGSEKACSELAGFKLGFLFFEKNNYKNLSGKPTRDFTNQDKISFIYNVVTVLFICAKRRQIGIVLVLNLGRKLARDWEDMPNLPVSL